MKTDLSKFTIGSYAPGAGKLKMVCWYFFNYYFFYSALPWPNKLKIMVLRLFGGKIGNNINFKPKIKIKNPWRLTIGDNCWVGESVWIDNLEDVVIGANVCISQGAMLLTGNHDYTLSSFPYRLGKIHIEDGVWVGAQAVVCPGVTCRAESILTVNSVASKDLDSMGIYTGNPAVYIRDRKFKD